MTLQPLLPLLLQPQDNDLPPPIFNVSLQCTADATGPREPGEGGTALACAPPAARWRSVLVSAVIVENTSQTHAVKKCERAANFFGIHSFKRGFDSHPPHRRLNSNERPHSDVQRAARRRAPRLHGLFAFAPLRDSLIFSDANKSIARINRQKKKTSARTHPPKRPRLPPASKRPPACVVLFRFILFI